METSTGTGKIWLILTFITNAFALVNMTTITWAVGLCVSFMAMRYYYYATKKLKEDRD